MRNVVTALALAMLIIGAWLLVRFRPGNLPSDQAGVAYIENPDGSVRRATETRPEERTLPIPADQPAASHGSTGATDGHAQLTSKAAMVPSISPKVRRNLG